MPEHATKSKGLILGNSGYDSLKFIALILLPALGTLYFGVAQIWGLPKAEEVVGTIVVVDAFLGGLLRYAAVAYNDSPDAYDGIIHVDDGPDTTNMRLQLTKVEDPVDIVHAKELRFKVSKEPTP